MAPDSAGSNPVGPPKERNKQMTKKESIMNVPVGANKRYIVTCGNDNFAGFDTLGKARAYVAMQKAKKKGGGGGGAPAAASGYSWNIKDTKG